MTPEQILYHAKKTPPECCMPWTLDEDRDKIMETHNKWKKGELYGQPDGHPRVAADQ